MLPGAERRRRNEMPHQHTGTDTAPRARGVAGPNSTTSGTGGDLRRGNDPRDEGQAPRSPCAVPPHHQLPDSTSTTPLSSIPPTPNKSPVSPNMHTDRKTQTDMQAGRQTDRETDRQEDGRTGRQTDGQIGTYTDRQKDRKIHR